MKHFCLSIGLGVSAALALSCTSNEGVPGSGGSPSASGAGGASGGAGMTSAGAGGATAGAAQGGGASSGAAGSAGMSMGGDAGSAGAAGSGGAGGSDMAPSTGCSKPATQELDEWVRYTLTVENLEREYFVRLPENYDPQKPYRLLFTLPGCGGKGDGVLPLYNAENYDAIMVGPSPDGECFVYDEESKDTAFFDAMLTAVQDSYCIDKNRIFSSGHSSGSWFSNVLSCYRSNVVRGTGHIAGGFAGSVNNCLPNKIAGIFVHDLNDNDNDISGGIKARDRLLMLNGCSNETQPIEPSPCVEYQGCAPGYPVVWCQTMGQGHSRQDDLSRPAIYNFFARF